jgi:hypothetical protein
MIKVGKRSHLFPDCDKTVREERGENIRVLNNYGKPGEFVPVFRTILPG